MRILGGLSACGSRQDGAGTKPEQETRLSKTLLKERDLSKPFFRWK